MNFNFRNVGLVHGVYNLQNVQATRKTSVMMETGHAGDAVRECSIASMGDVPFDYVPPPTNLVMNAIPYKWPTGQEWDKAYTSGIDW
jgi:hypothetical protein